MIKKLQWKVVAVSMGVLLISFTVILLTLNIFMQTRSDMQTDRFLELVADHDGMFVPRMDIWPDSGMFFSEDGNQSGELEEDANKVPNGKENIEANGEIKMGPLPPKEVLRAGQFFWVKFDENDMLIDMGLNVQFELSEADAEKIARSAAGKSKPRGNIDNYRYLVEDKDYGMIVVCSESGVEMLMLRQLASISVIVAIISAVVLFIVIIFFSRWAVRPVQDAFDRQRRFISDASHELRTPLTTISANVDVLENESGENKWLSRIREQTMRMSQLTHELLQLAHLDESKKDNEVMFDVDFSNLVMGATLEFEGKSFEEDKELTYGIDDGIHCVCNRESMKQVVGILLDNAMKHTEPHGKVHVTLKKEGDKARISVFNSGQSIPENERKLVFERFYRSDESRSRETGGYGLGLSIAKSIMDAHKGKIYVSDARSDGTTFEVIVPCSKK